MRVGYLHIGRREHGVARYGYLLAAAARTQPDLTVSETDVILTESHRNTREILRLALRELASIDVLHVQYNNQVEKSVWGRKWSQLWNLAALTADANVPLVVTVHDIYQHANWAQLCGSTLREFHESARGLLQKIALGGGPTVGIKPSSQGSLRYRIKRSLQPDAIALRWLNREAKVLLVCSNEERRRLEGFVGGSRVRVVPHFVEKRTLRTDAEAARRALGLGGKRVVTLLGYIHPRKGHQLLVEAMQHLPPDTIVVFAGRAEPDHQDFLTRLQSLAEATGVLERLRVTGHLSEQDLEIYLSATDLAACPFTNVSASGSLSTWISAGTPILATDLPLIAEYNRMVPDAIDTFQPYTAPALAQAIHEHLRMDDICHRARVARLRERLGLESIVEQHIAIYREIAASSSTSTTRRYHPARLPREESHAG